MIRLYVAAALAIVAALRSDSFVALAVAGLLCWFLLLPPRRVADRLAPPLPRRPRTDRMPAADSSYASWLGEQRASQIEWSTGTESIESAVREHIEGEGRRLHAPNVSAGMSAGESAQ